MMLCKVADFNSKELGNHFRKNEKYLDILLEKHGKILEFFSLEKWEPCALRAIILNHISHPCRQNKIVLLAN